MTKLEPVADQQFQAGDLLIINKIVVPGKISDAQRKLWEQLARESRFNPRD